MRKLRAFFLRLRGLFGTRRSDADFAAEIESHVVLDTLRTKPAVRHSFASAAPNRLARRSANAALFRGSKTCCMTCATASA